ncbi:DHH family phosphoesterase [Lactiplantibacillus mudanjiangensis]|uniref:DHH family phosphoesterase [Lactobacillus sp.] n=1 Tax=Lactiplantibacillus mudanjiangensis TaxID=1296538 RepID=A0A660E2K2_9LACO|nr:bifunctional oligoribonuclease/PAP phosphatase NrnA [Lactiplantibacillus mudanjiangensis]VDG19214.1 DHH family phosphoesterase [Lactobacillus sp.] [Lactiplantibacillus mudanjiangensis]VDG25623.1 DHH family phosphoesterase [Lactobacillus sp.] [Lactiplantibacillus mudanjiangensis]VDG29979.1 DHH family phosphoesterase [Lactobacillus sp.] [Lactiplantibacillus mudanjiangensis]VDG33284.1 DHH family phosphoesterase [Lactobacillus sp.] [Lactiplantibacillus mudanjiangensis]
MTVQTEIFNLIKQAKTIIIHRHQRPDPDAIGSQLGMAEIIKTSFPDKKVLAPGKQYHGFDWLGQMDTVTEADYEDALVLVLDTANQPRVDGEYYNTGKQLVKIDHHPNDDAFGDPQWVDVDASSTSELVYQFYAANEAALTLTANAARLLYAGIVGDTGRFLYDATHPSTLRVAAALMEAGANAPEVNRIEDTITLPVARLSAYVYEHLTQLESGAAYVILTNEIMDSFEIGDASTAGVVPLPGRIDTVKSWAIFVQQKEGDYRIRLRSKGPAINEVAKLHGGGGHPLASGAKAKDQAEIEAVVRELDQVDQADQKEV